MNQTSKINRPTSGATPVPFLRSSPFGRERHDSQLEKHSLQELARIYHQSGCPNVFSELYRKTRALVLGCAFKLLKEEQQALDISSEVFSKLMFKLREVLPLNFKSWLFSVTKNQCLELLRNHRRDPVVEHLDSSEEREGCTEGEEINILEYGPAIHQAIARLNHGQATCIRLFFIAGMRYKEICEESGMTMKEVKSHIQNGKRNLRQMLRPTWDHYVELA